MFSENTTQVSQNDAFESSDFLYDINVDSFTGCHSRLYIYIYVYTTVEQTGSHEN